MTLHLVSILSLALLFVLPAQLAAFITQNSGELTTVTCVKTLITQETSGRGKRVHPKLFASILASKLVSLDSNGEL